jgi:hypothetical protein
VNEFVICRFIINAAHGYINYTYLRFDVDSEHSRLLNGNLLREGLKLKQMCQDALSFQPIEK